MPETRLEEGFDVPCGLMGKSLMDVLRAKQGPCPAERRQMIRVVIEPEIMVSSSLLKKEMAVVAPRMTQQFPESLTDRLNKRSWCWVQFASKADEALCIEH